VGCASSSVACVEKGITPSTFLLHIFSLSTIPRCSRHFFLLNLARVDTGNDSNVRPTRSPSRTCSSQWWFRSLTTGITDLSFRINRRNISQKTCVCTKQLYQGNGLSNSFTINNSSLTWIQLRCDFHLLAVLRQEQNLDQPTNRRIRHPNFQAGAPITWSQRLPSIQFTQRSAPC